MNCPQQFLEPLTEILKFGLLNIRVAATNGDPKRCHVEAYHIHNLPSLICNYSEDRLKYYLEIEKPDFEKNSVGVNLSLFEQQWAKLTI